MAGLRGGIEREINSLLLIENLRQTFRRNTNIRNRRGLMLRKMKDRKVNIAKLNYLQTLSCSAMYNINHMIISVKFRDVIHKLFKNVWKTIYISD